jgi:hypothetical protein
LNRGHNVFAKIVPTIQPRQPGLDGQVTPGNIIHPQPASTVRDLFLHALFARIAFTNNDTTEFRTVYDPTTNVIELDIPQEAINVLDQITGIQRGPNFKTFINWLIGSTTLTPSLSRLTGLLADPNFTSGLSLRVWLGANLFNYNDEYLALVLPATVQSVVGHNFRTPAPPVGQPANAPSDITVSLIWSLPATGATSFTIRASTTISQTDGTPPVFGSVDATLSASNTQEAGAIIKTGIMIIPAVPAGSIVSLLLTRNFVGSPDPNTQALILVGLMVEPDGN